MNSPSTPLGLIGAFAVLALVAAGLAAILVAAVDRLTGPATESLRVRRLVRVAFVGGAIALGWWEIVARGQMPLIAGGPAVPADWSVLLTRYLSHLVLFTLLAAATWTDVRQRVIPDEITVPGLLLGLGWVSLCPDVLLPVAIEVPRSFARPLVEPDVLGAWGGLHAGGVPAWLPARPAIGGLLGAAAAFLAWWVAGTAPACDVDGRLQPVAAGWRRLCEPRLWAAGIGLGVVAAAWARGGSHWTGAWTGLIGILVAGGLVWFTRIGASRALGQEALGFGDVTLMAMVGSWLGWQACLLACSIAVFIGLGHGLFQLVRRRENELPFGPSLCLAIVFVVVTWRSLWEQAAPFFERPGELAVVVAAIIVLTALSLFVWNRVRGGPPEPA